MIEGAKRKTRGLFDNLHKNLICMPNTLHNFRVDCILTRARQLKDLTDSKFKISDLAEAQTN